MNEENFKPVWKVSANENVDATRGAPNFPTLHNCIDSSSQDEHRDKQSFSLSDVSLTNNQQECTDEPVDKQNAKTENESLVCLTNAVSSSSEKRLDALVLASYAISCSDFPVLYTIVSQYDQQDNVGNKLEDFAKDKSSVSNGLSLDKTTALKELNKIRENIEQLAAKDDANLPGGTSRQHYSLLYHKLASECERAVKEFLLKHEVCEPLIQERIQTLRSNIRCMEQTLLLLESYGNRRQGEFGFQSSWIHCFGEDCSWSPYEQTFTNIWRMYNQTRQKEPKSKENVGIDNNDSEFEAVFYNNGNPHDIVHHSKSEEESESVFPNPIAKRPFDCNNPWGSLWSKDPTMDAEDTIVLDGKKLRR